MITGRICHIAVSLRQCVALAAILVVCAAFYGEVDAETAAPATRSMLVRRATATVQIDGRLDEADWQACEKVILAGYRPGVILGDTTECRILWDDNYLYLSWFCADRDVWGTYTVRDEPLYNEEVVEAFINPDGDRETYFELEVSPLGTLWDGKITISGSGRAADISWNSRLVSWVHVVGTANNSGDSDSYWSVEMALPLEEMESAAHIPPQDGDSWRLNFYRVEIPGRNKSLTEYAAWSPVSGTTFHDPDSFGEIVFSTQPVRVVRGDTDGDGKINIFDLLNLLRALKDPSLSQGNEAYDVDVNGSINIFDILGLLKLLKG